MREAFDAELRKLLEEIMEMGGLAEKMVSDAVRGLIEQNETALAAVFQHERRVNLLQNEIDEQAVRLTVTQQPVGRDVRLIFAASRCAADVERVADQAVNIAGNTRHHFDADVQAEVPEELPAMADAARRALVDALGAFIMRDVALAEGVLKNEPHIDALRDAVFKKLLYQMITEPLASPSALSLLLVSRNLERIGDHATNVAEEVIYLVRGKDIRHGRG